MNNDSSPFSINGGALFLLFVCILITFILLWVFRSYFIVEKPSTPPTPSAPSESSLSKGQWCFVGSDMTGRWCVKTPEDGLCPSDRAFPSRSECEMKTGSALPLGINQNHDTTMIPIAGLTIA